AVPCRRDTNKEENVCGIWFLCVCRLLWVAALTLALRLIAESTAQASLRWILAGVHDHRSCRGMTTNFAVDRTQRGIEPPRPFPSATVQLENFEQELGVPACALSARFNASLTLIGAHETEGEAADDGPVFGAVSSSVARPTSSNQFILSTPQCPRI